MDLREEVAGGQKKLRNEEFHNLYSSPHVVGSDEATEDGACSMYGRNQECIQNLFEKSEGKRSFGRPMCRWKTNFKLCHKQIVCGMYSCGVG